MRLPEEQIKQAILHPELSVRTLALHYFSRSFSDDTTVMPFVVEAVEKFGLVHPQTTELFPPPVVSLLGHPQTLNHLGHGPPLGQLNFRLSQPWNDLLRHESFLRHLLPPIQLGPNRHSINQAVDSVTGARSFTKRIDIHQPSQ